MDSVGPLQTYVVVTCQQLFCVAQHKTVQWYTKPDDMLRQV